MDSFIAALRVLQARSRLQRHGGVYALEIRNPAELTKIKPNWDAFVSGKGPCSRRRSDRPLLPVGLSPTSRLPSDALDAPCHPLSAIPYPPPRPPLPVFAAEFRTVEPKLFERPSLAALGERLERWTRFASAQLSPMPSDRFATLVHGDYKVLYRRIEPVACLHRAELPRVPHTPLIFTHVRALLDSP